MDMHLNAVLAALVNEVMWIKAELKQPGISGDAATALVDSLTKEFLQSCAGLSCADKALSAE